MSFLERVQAWLRAEQRPVPGALPVGFDLEVRRGRMWFAMEALLPRERLSEVHDLWSTRGALERFARSAIWHLRLGVGATWKVAQLEGYVDLRVSGAARAAWTPATRAPPMSIR